MDSTVISVDFGACSTTLACSCNKLNTKQVRNQTISTYIAYTSLGICFGEEAFDFSLQYPKTSFSGKNKQKNT